MAGSPDTEHERIVKALPSEPRLSRDVFKVFESNDDDYVIQVLNVASNMGVVWTEDFQGWNEVFTLFVEGKRGTKVFETWSKIPAVRTFFEKEQPVDCLVLGQYDTALHALSHSGRHDLISIFQEELSNNPDVGKVSGFHNNFNLPQL